MKHLAIACLLCLAACGKADEPTDAAPPPAAAPGPAPAAAPAQPQRVTDNPCPVCHGSGSLPGPVGGRPMPCSTCRGTGKGR